MTRAPTLIALGALTLASLLLSAGGRAQTPAASTRERTCFQTHDPWAADLQFRSDVAICYGIDAGIDQRIASWKARGYVTHLMTGVSWGQYQDYLYGRFDGARHVDEAQTDRYGKVISHGGDVYYMSPGEGFGRFLAQGVKRAMDAGAEAVHLEEPEFWVRAGYSEGFKREWKAYYKEDWVAPHTSADAQYRASLLKYYLYRRALAQVFAFVKEENARTGKHVKCYVPTHSLINYAHWNIVSPESSLTGVGADGYVAQVWTGTARTPNVYEGKLRERTFETAFLEYGSMMNVVQAGGGRVWFLNDPIEDDPDHSWDDYRANWESTLTASLLWPQVGRFEVMPWPERIFRGRYPAVERRRGVLGKRAAPERRVPIPPAYATEIMTVITTLNDMEQPQVAWDCGSRDIGVVVSDSMMFQREGPNPSDKHLGSFFGLALPLLKRGIPVEPVQLENAAIPAALGRYKVLLLTYEGMKPMSPDVHRALADWVEKGGALVFLGDDSDPFNAVRSWWNSPAEKTRYAAPREHLFERLHLPIDAPAGLYRHGKGTLIYDTSSPAALTYKSEGAEHVRALVRRACAAAKLEYRETSHLALRRGPYVIAAGLDESTAGATKVLEGHFVDLFSPDLALLGSVSLKPGARRFLLDLDRAVPRSGPSVLASAGKVVESSSSPDGGFRFVVEGPDKTEAVARVRLLAAPRDVSIDGRPLAPEARVWDSGSRTILLRFPNAAGGRTVVIR